MTTIAKKTMSTAIMALQGVYIYVCNNTREFENRERFGLYDNNIVNTRAVLLFLILHYECSARYTIPDKKILTSVFFRPRIERKSAGSASKSPERLVVKKKKFKSRLDDTIITRCALRVSSGVLLKFRFTLSFRERVH